MIINGLSWRVLLVSPTHPMLTTPKGTHALGTCDKPTQTVYIDNSVGKTELREVLVHELAHAAMYSYGVEISPREEELVATVIGEYGETVLKKAKMVYKKLKKRL